MLRRCKAKTPSLHCLDQAWRPSQDSAPGIWAQPTSSALSPARWAERPRWREKEGERECPGRSPVISSVRVLDAEVREVWSLGSVWVSSSMCVLGCPICPSAAPGFISVTRVLHKRDRYVPAAMTFPQP